jgi:hypothetical protein
VFEVCDVKLQWQNAVMVNLWAMLQALRKPEPVVPDNLVELVEKANKALEVILQIAPEQEVDRAREIVTAIRKGAPVLNEDGKVQEPSEPSEEEVAALKRLSGLL